MCVLVGRDHSPWTGRGWVRWPALPGLSRTNWFIFYFFNFHSPSELFFIEVTLAYKFHMYNIILLPHPYSVLTTKNLASIHHYIVTWFQNGKSWASLVAQWWRIHLPMQETQVRSLVWEDPTGSGSIKPVCHNHWACALKSRSRNYWAHAPQLLKPKQLQPVLHNKRSNRNEKPTNCNEERAPLAASREKPIKQLKPNRVKNK